MSGLNCKIKKECPDRHPPLCKNFVKNTCGFLVGSKFIVYSNCAFFHPPGVNQEPTSINSVMLTTTATVQNTPQDARSEIAPGVNQEPTSINSVMLTTTATVQNTPQDARSEIAPGVNQEPTSINSVMLTTTATVQNTPQDARSEIEVKSGISPADQVTKQLSDLDSKIVKMEQNISMLADKIANMESKFSQVDEAIKQVDSMQTNQANQDLRQEMDKMKADITDKVDRVGTELNSLAEKVTVMKNDLRDEMYTIEYDIIEKSLLWYEIEDPEGKFLKLLEPQVHKMVKEYQQLHKT